MNLSDRIRDFALYLGYDRVGFTTADDFDEYLEILEARGDMYDFHLANPLNIRAGSRPRSVMPEARSIIVLALDYAKTAFPADLLPLVGRVYQARCYYPQAHSLNGLRLKQMLDFLAAEGCLANPGLFVPARCAGARAGISRFGRNTFAYVDGVGSFVILYTLVIDRELDYGQPTMDGRCPADCRKCLEACPTGALYEPYHLNPRRCLAFNAWKTVEGAGCGISEYIPADIREKMDRHVHGCDVCQEACPRNHKKVTGTFPRDNFLELIAREVTLKNLLIMPENFWESRVRPIMYNYIRKPVYFQRNAAVALGNVGAPETVGELGWALNQPESVLRGHAAWALGRIGGGKAKKNLEKSLAGEGEAEVRREISQALERLA